MKTNEFQKILDEAKNCWNKFESYDGMIQCLKDKGYKDASIKLKGLTLDEMGYILGVTRERIRQIYEQAVKKIKKETITHKDLMDFL